MRMSSLKNATEATTVSAEIGALVSSLFKGRDTRELHYPCRDRREPRDHVANDEMYRCGVATPTKVCCKICSFPDFPSEIRNTTLLIR
jgi:hypothetical protein